MQFDLLKLPIELVIYVVEFVDSRKALARLACTSKQMQEIAEPLLYQNILLKGPGGLKALETAIEHRPKRALAVQELEVPSHVSMELSMAKLERLLMKLKGLRHMMFESPFVNAINFESEHVWTGMTNMLFRPFCQAAINDTPSPRPLEKLTKLTLHMNGPLSPYWDLDDRSLSIFKHPTLERVHVSCMNLIDTDKIDLEETFFTPLKHLILEECNIDVPALAALLKLPKALEGLDLGENCYNFAQFPSVPIHSNANLLFWTRPDATMAALKQQAHSLKILTYLQNEQYAYNSHGFHMSTAMKFVAFPIDGFEDFPLLEKVHLKGYCPNFTRAVLNYHSPPNLREVIAEDFDPIYTHYNEEKWSVQQEPIAEQIAVQLPYLSAKHRSSPKSLERITLIYNENGGSEDQDREKSVARRQLDGVAKILKKDYGLSLFVVRKTISRYYPPFLYGEPTPKEELLFDGDTGKFTEVFKKWVRIGNTTAAGGVRMLETNGSDYSPEDSSEDEDEDDDSDDGVWPVV